MHSADYWLRSYNEQRHILQQIAQDELGDYAAEHELLVRNGKLVKPEAYP